MPRLEIQSQPFRKKLFDIKRQIFAERLANIFYFTIVKKIFWLIDRVSTVFI